MQTIMVSRRVTFIASVVFQIPGPVGADDIVSIGNELSEGQLNHDIGGDSATAPTVAVTCDPDHVSSVVEIGAAFGATKFDVTLIDTNPPVAPAKAKTKKTKTAKAVAIDPAVNPTIQATPPGQDTEGDPSQE